MFKNQDYLVKLLNDNAFIFNSFLSGYVHFSQKNDPFILKPYIQTQNEKYSTIFAIS